MVTFLIIHILIYRGDCEIPFIWGIIDHHSFKMDGLYPAWWSDLGTVRVPYCTVLPWK